MSDTPAHLLVVDDDERLRSLLQKFLRREGFLVTTAHDAAHARRILSGLDFDLVVLDVMMPGEDGISFCRWLHERGDMAVLLLTAREETADRIAGLEAGADDYLAKPFDPRELVLRINAILRRVPRAPSGPRHLQIGPLRYDLDRGELWAGEQPVRLTTSEAELMRLFATQPGKVLSRAALVSELGRGTETVQERAIDVQITRLRRKIEPDPRQPRYLQTVRGLGYMLAPD